MPREARSIYDGKIYHIMSQGINKEYILYKDTYKKMYIKLMYEQAKENNLGRIIYCIMDNHVHIILNVQKTEDMSKFMQTVNMKYAMLYNRLEDRVGVVFRNRFKSELIYDEKYFYNCVNYVHNNPVKAGIVTNAKDYKFSSANDYNLERLLNEIRIKNEIPEETIDNFIDVDKNENNKENIKRVINKFNEKHNIDEIDIKNKKMLRLLVIDIKEKTNATNREISNELRDFKVNCLKLY